MGDPGSKDFQAGFVAEDANVPIMRQTATMAAKKSAGAKQALPCLQMLLPLSARKQAGGHSPTQGRLSSPDVIL